jgi:hypothetical protein
LKTTDWPAAVARDFLLAAANTVPLFIPDGSVVPLENRTVDEDIRVLAQLANQIQMNDGKTGRHNIILYRRIECSTIIFILLFRRIQTTRYTILTITHDATSTTT